MSVADTNMGAIRDISNALQGVIDCLERGTGEILVAEPTRGRALGCIERMLDFVKAHPQSIATPARGFVPNIGAA